MTFATITYILPTWFGAHIDYYHLSVLPIVLTATFGVVATAQIMKYFARRDQNAEGRRHREDHLENESPGASEAATNAAEPSWIETFIENINSILLMTAVVGCELFVRYTGSFAPS